MSKSKAMIMKKTIAAFAGTVQRFVPCWQYGWLASVRGAVIEFALWTAGCAGIPIALLLMAMGLGRITGWF